MYAVVAPGFACVYSNWADVERIKKLYPYPKWVKCKTDEEAQEWIRRNSYGHRLSRVYNYGNTLKDLHIYVNYHICKDSVLYVLDCSRIGRVQIDSDNVEVKYEGSKISVKLNDIFVSNETIAGHMSAIYNLLKILGDYIDVNIELPYYSLFYSLTSYSRGNCRAITIVKKVIEERLGAVAFSLSMDKFSEEEYYVRDSRQ